MTPAVYAVSSTPALLGWLLLVAAVVWSIRSLGAAASTARLDWKWWLLLGGILLCFRWPLIWVPHEIQPDESQLIAGAITLRHDPLFWRSVDGGTAGPLDYYPLIAAGFVPPPAGYAVARIIAALLIAGMLAALGESLACVTSRGIARVAVLPPLAFEAFTTNAEFVHYSTEMMPGFLLALALYFVVRQSVRPSAATLGAATLILGAVPFSKLQAVPIAGVLWIFLMVGEVRAGRKANIGRLCLGALLPAVVAAVVVGVTGETANLLIPYVFNNFAYVQRGVHTISEVLLHLGIMAELDGYLALWFAGSAVFVLGVFLLRWRIPSFLRHLQLAAIFLLLTAVACTVVPGRYFDHYMNLLTLPLSGVLGVCLAIAVQSKTGTTAFRIRIVTSVFLACTFLPLVLLRASPRVDPFARFNFRSPTPSERELVQALHAITKPGEALGLWGWRNSLYVDTGLRQATRQAQNEAQLLPGPWQNYFLGSYLTAIEASAPPVFVDTMGAGNFMYHDRALGHEIFPMLHDWIRAHYTFFGEVDTARIYVRNDRFRAAQKVWPPGRASP